VAVKYGGIGRHIAAVHPDELVVLGKIQISLVLMYIPAVNLPRLGLLALYIRIFKASKYRWIAYGVAATMVLEGAVLWSIMWAQCVPFKYNWDKTIPGGHCIDIMSFDRWGTFPNILIDVIMLLLPVPMIWDLKMSPAQKIGLTLTFLTGSL
jgi:hypothetical protein